MLHANFTYFKSRIVLIQVQLVQSLNSYVYLYINILLIIDIKDIFPASCANLIHFLSYYDI